MHLKSNLNVCSSVLVCVSGSDEFLNEFELQVRVGSPSLLPVEEDVGVLLVEGGVDVWLLERGVEVLLLEGEVEVEGLSVAERGI